MKAEMKENMTANLKEFVDLASNLYRLWPTEMLRLSYPK